MLFKVFFKIYLNKTVIYIKNSGQPLNIETFHKTTPLLFFHMKKIVHIISKRTKTPTTIPTTSAVFDSSVAPVI